MPSYDQWDPYKTHVQGGLPEGNFMSGQFVLVCAGPPFFNQIAFPNSGASSDGVSPTLVYPIGLAQNGALSQNKAISRIFEIGSDRCYFVTGRTIGQLSLGRVVYHGASLLRTMYAYYGTMGDTDTSAYQVQPLLTEANNVGIKPFSTGATPDNSGEAGRKSGLKSIHIPPGYDNMFMNLASDLFSQPMGLLLVLKDNAKNTIASMYLEQCYIPQYMIAVDSTGLIMQESVAVQYERIVSVKTTQLKVVSGVLADQHGGFATNRVV